LAGLRKAISEDTEGRLKAILDELVKRGFDEAEERLVRVPRGFAADHPRADLLRLKSVFVCSPVISQNIAETPGVIDQCVALAATVKPLNDWLSLLHGEPLGRLVKAKTR
jgi:uncharacterized protein (DUF2461 family)